MNFLMEISDETIEIAAVALNLEAGRQRGLALEDDWHTITEQERGGWRLCARSALMSLALIKGNQMGLTQVDDNELAATREQAALAIPYKNESERLAVALRKADPENRLLRSDQWTDFFAAYDKRVGNFGPDHEFAEAVKDAVE